MKRASLFWVIVLIAAVGVPASLWVARPRIERCIESGKAENVALDSDPFVAARASLAYIKRTGRVPETLAQCVTVDEEASGDWNNRGKARSKDLQALIVEWPPDQHDIVLRSVFERIELSFPKDPNQLVLRDGRLLWLDTGEPAHLISIRGHDSADRAGLQSANVWAWRAWSCMVRGEKTGIEWLDAYELPVP